MASSFNAPTTARDQKRKSSPLRERDDARPHPPMMPPAKKARFVWSTEHREQFVNAVTQLGNEAVPKKIHELMNIPGLTREHVASHLQKYRLKREKMGKAATEEIKHGPNNQLGSSCTRLFSTQAAYGGAYTCSTIAPQYDDDSNSNALHFHPLLFKEDAIFISPSSQQAAYAATHTTRAQVDYDHSNTTNIIIIP